MLRELESQVEMDTWEFIAIRYTLGLGDLVRKSHIVILGITLTFAIGTLTASRSASTFS